MRAVPLSLLLLALAAAPAYADHVAGATYRGTHSSGGTIELTLSADGRRVQSYRATGVDGDTCQFVAQGDAGDWPGAAIEGEAFEYRLYDAILFRGSFTSRLKASGTLRLYNHATSSKPACDTGVVTWTAETTADGDPPPLPGPGGGGSPAPSGGAPTKPSKRTVATRVKLRRAGSRLVGKVTSADASCRGKRTLTLRWGRRKLATARTKADGSFSFKRSRKTRNRSVNVLVASRTVASSTCGAAGSPSVKG